MSEVKQVTLGNTEPSDGGGRKLNIPDQELGGIILVSSKIKHLHNYCETKAHIFIIT